jgi:hypothetical protein
VSPRAFPTEKLFVTACTSPHPITCTLSLFFYWVLLPLSLPYPPVYQTFIVHYTGLLLFSSNTMSTTPPDFLSLPLDELAKAHEEICQLAAQVQVLSVHINQQRPKEFTYKELITRIANLKDHLSLAKKRER